MSTVTNKNISNDSESLSNITTTALISKPLDLSYVRSELIRLEETIIFGLIERAQFARNSPIYVSGKQSLLYPTSQLCFRDYLFSQTENLHAAIGRYHRWDESCFFDHDHVNQIGNVPKVRQEMNPPIKPNNINYNRKITSVYETFILPEICPENIDDKHYGSSSLSDIAILQAISKRIHFGLLVAEIKFKAKPELYSALIKAGNAAGVMKELTIKRVEDQVVRRVKIKASTYGTDPVQQSQKNIEIKDRVVKVSPSLIARLYQDYIMPLTKEVELDYLMERLNQNNVAYVSDVVAEGSGYEAVVTLFGKNTPFQRVNNVKNAFSAILRNQVNHAVVTIEKDNKVCPLTQKSLVSNNLLISGEHYSQKRRERFFIISTKSSSPSGNDKTTIVFELKDLESKDRVGALSRALEIFAKKGVNLTCIQSIPDPTSTGGYSFYVEMEGHVENTNIKHTLEELSKISTDVKWLGSYVNRSIKKQKSSGKKENDTNGKSKKRPKLQ